MPAFSETHEAAIRASVALLEAFDPECSQEKRRELLVIALESAMDATAVPKAERPDVGQLVDGFVMRTAGER